MNCQITSGLLFTCSWTIVSCIEKYIRFRTVYPAGRPHYCSSGQWEADWQMKFNVVKCHSMRVTRHQHHKEILFDYSLHNQTLENIQSAKIFGITIADNMNWGQHNSEISSKATKTLGFLCRNLQEFSQYIVLHS